MNDEPVDLTRVNASFQLVPQNKALGLTAVAATRAPAQITARLPWDERWVGNPDTRVVHGGVITTLLDASCGASVFLGLEKRVPIATLDLRIDYLAPAKPDADIFAHAEVLKITRNVAFVRAVAYQERIEQPIATAAATFMIGTKARLTQARADAKVEGP